MKINYRFVYFLLFISQLIITPLVFAQVTNPSSETIGISWKGSPGIVETVNQIMERERLTPPLPPGTVRLMDELELKHLLPPPKEDPNAPKVSQWPPEVIKKGKAQKDALQIQSQPGKILSPQTVGVSFLGPVLSESGWIPPDTQGDVGPTQVLMIANGRIKVYDKLGNLGPINASSDVFFNSVRNGANTGDPRVRYDRLSGRWFVTAFNMATPNRILIAVSSGSVITSSSSFTFYQFQHDLVGPTPNPDTGAFADYPTLGVDANALYIGVNVFTYTYIGSTGFVVKKSDLFIGTLTVTAFRQIANSSALGCATPYGVHNDDPSFTEGYFIGTDYTVTSRLVVRRISNPGGTPTISGNLNLTVPATTHPILQPHLGAAANRRLDAIDWRLFAAHIKKDKITGVSTLWTAHTNEVNSSGVSTVGGGRNGSRWYQIGSMTTTPTLIQSGTLYDPAATNPLGYWMPSVAMSGQGHMALGCSRASVNNYTEIAAAGKLSSDPLGTTQAPTLVIASTTAYNVQGVDGQRWGDYSQTVVDPNDDQTMWTFQEYCNSTNSWGVRAIQLIAPPPATPTTAVPSTILTGQASVNVVVNGTSISGSEFFDPGPDPGGPGFLNHITASVSGGVVVNSITFNTPTQVTLNISTVGVANGPKDVTITNPDGQSRTGLGIITITDPGGGVCTLTCPANIIKSNDPNQCGAITTYSPTISGSCGTVTCSPASGSFFPIGTTTVSCTATAGPSCSFTVTVNDNQIPVISCPSAITKNTDPNLCSAVVTYTVTATDNCPGVIVACTPPSGSTFPKGTTTVNCTATDASSNTQTCSFPVNVIDAQAPSITCPANIAVESDASCNGVNVSYSAPTVTDNCPGVTTICSPASGSYFTVGTTPVTCTAKDASNNISTCSFTVTVHMRANISIASNPVFFRFGCKSSAIYTKTLVIKNSGGHYGGGVMNWTVSTSASEITLTPTSGVEGGNLNIKVNPAGLAFGTYTRTITLTGVNSVSGIPACNSPLTLTIKIEVEPDVAVTQTLAVGTASFTQFTNSYGQVFAEVKSNTTPISSFTVTMTPCQYPNGMSRLRYIKRKISLSTTATNRNVDLKLYYSNSEMTGITRPDLLTIWQQPVVGGGWFNRGGTSNVYENNVVTTGQTNTDGVWAIAHPWFPKLLAIKLIDAQYDRTTKNAVIQWESPLQTNDDGFFIERSSRENADYGEWETVGQIRSNASQEYGFSDKLSYDGKYFYRLYAVDTDGVEYESEIFSVNVSALPMDYVLEQNHPNPFGAATQSGDLMTTIRYQLPEASKVVLKVFDIYWREVAVLVDKEQSAGMYEVKFDQTNLPSGTYLYRIVAGSFTQIRKMNLMK